MRKKQMTKNCPSCLKCEIHEKSNRNTCTWGNSKEPKYLSERINLNKECKLIKKG